MSSQVTSGSSQATSGSTVKSQMHIPAFTPRPRQDPPGMSALFVAVTIVCALGATAIVTTAGRDGTSVEGWSSALTDVLRSVGHSAVVTAQAELSDTLAVEREMGETNADVESTGTVVHDAAKSTTQEFAQVYNEITSLKNEISDLRSTQEQGAAEVRKVTARLDGVTGAVASTREQVGTVRANLNLLQTSLDELSLGRDSETDRINKRLAKIEDVISIRADVTAAIPRQTFPPMPRRRAPRSGHWTAEQTGNGTYLVKGPTGTYEVTVGSIVPGLGRIEAVKHQDGKLSLVTGKAAE